MTGYPFLKYFREGSGAGELSKCYESGGENGDVVGEHLGSLWFERVGTMIDDMVDVP